MIRRTPSGLFVATALVAIAGACSSTPQPPGPGESRGYVPPLGDQAVMVLPFQLRSGVSGDPDAELQFALNGRGPAIPWVFPTEIREALRASPSLQAPLTGLPVQVFLQAEVDRLGDPVFGVLRRLGALTGADVAVLPVAVFATAAADSTPARVQASVAVMSVRDGRVLWYGVEAEEGSGDDPATLAGVMDRLGRRLVPGPVGTADGGTR